MNRFITLGVFALASCNPPAAPPEPEVEVAAATSKAEPKAEPNQPQAETPVAIQPKKEEPPPTFPFPNDSAGKLLPKVVTPPMPPSPAAEKFGAAPKPRTAPARLLDPDSLPKLIHTAAPLPGGKPVVAVPTAPPERVPFDLGIGSGAAPSRVVFAEAPGNKEKARDVKLPPDLAPLGRQQPDRAGLDDPTAEPGNAAIANKSPTPVLGQSPFLKVGLPDPFELAEQVKPKVAPAAEPSTAPVVITPQRVK